MGLTLTRNYHDVHRINNAGIPLRSWTSIKNKENVAHINPDELNDYFISMCDDAAVAAQYDTKNPAAGSGYEFVADHVVDVLYAMNGIENKVVGVDGISIEFLKMMLGFVAEPITHLVNLSIGQRKFAISWKHVGSEISCFQYL
jgi:hypothetical protein